MNRGPAVGRSAERTRPGTQQQRQEKVNKGDADARTEARPQAPEARMEVMNIPDEIDIARQNFQKENPERAGNLLAVMHRDHRIEVPDVSRGQEILLYHSRSRGILTVPANSYLWNTDIRIERASGGKLAISLPYGSALGEQGGLVQLIAEGRNHWIQVLPGETANRPYVLSVSSTIFKGDRTGASILISGGTQREDNVFLHRDNQYLRLPRLQNYGDNPPADSFCIDRFGYVRAGANIAPGTYTFRIGNRHYDIEVRERVEPPPEIARLTRVFDAMHDAFAPYAGRSGILDQTTAMVAATARQIADWLRSRRGADDTDWRYALHTRDGEARAMLRGVMSAQDQENRKLLIQSAEEVRASGGTAEAAHKSIIDLLDALWRSLGLGTAEGRLVDRPYVNDQPGQANGGRGLYEQPNRPLPPLQNPVPAPPGQRVTPPAAPQQPPTTPIPTPTPEQPRQPQGPWAPPENVENARRTPVPIDRPSNIPLQLESSGWTVEYQWHGRWWRIDTSSVERDQFEMRYDERTNQVRFSPSRIRQKLQKELQANPLTIRAWKRSSEQQGQAHFFHIVPDPATSQAAFDQLENDNLRRTPENLTITPDQDQLITVDPQVPVLLGRGPNVENTQPLFPGQTRTVDSVIVVRDENGTVRVRAYADTYAGTANAIMAIGGNVNRLLRPTIRGYQRPEVLTPLDDLLKRVCRAFGWTESDVRSNRGAPGSRPGNAAVYGQSATEQDQAVTYNGQLLTAIQEIGGRPAQREPELFSQAQHRRSQELSKRVITFLQPIEKRRGIS